jgi:hypothetical protein
MIGRLRGSGADVVVSAGYRCGGQALVANRRLSSSDRGIRHAGVACRTSESLTRAMPSGVALIGVGVGVSIVARCVGLRSRDAGAICRVARHHVALPSRVKRRERTDDLSSGADARLAGVTGRAEVVVAARGPIGDGIALPFVRDAHRARAVRALRLARQDAS